MAAKRLFLGIDVSTTGAKALLIDEQGAVVASASTELTVSTPRPLWSEQDPHEWWEGTAASIRRALAEAGRDRRRCARRRHDRPDARADDARQRQPGAPAGDPLERSAHGAGVRRDHRADRLRPPARPHRQQDADRLHRAEDPLGAQARAGRLCPHRAHPAAEGLRAFPADRRLCGGQGRRGRDAALRPEAPRLGAGDARRAGHPGRVAAEELRRAGGDGADHG